ncbi:MAG: hypothetical protein OXC94_04880 [Chloroflexi bacterium]|nr:hypothetical protein [Chloroflexota bacterium]
MRPAARYAWPLALLLAALVACTSSGDGSPAAQAPVDSGGSRPAAAAEPVATAPVGTVSTATAEPAATAPGGTASTATAERAATAPGGTASTATAEPAATAPGGTASTATAEPAATAALVTPTPELGFPTGPAVLVASNYVPPGDRVDSTGAFLPANGKPTLVFVDAIW